MKQGDPKNMTERGSGRTFRQIQKLRPGDIFLVHTLGHKKYCESMMREHKIGDGVFVQVACGRHPDWLMGTSSGRWVEIDHYLWDFWNHSQNDRTRDEFIRYRENILPINNRSGVDNDRHEDSA